MKSNVTSATSLRKESDFGVRLIAVAFLCVVTLPLSSRGEASKLGSCFRIRYRNSNGCGQLVRLGITQESCCAGHYSRGWSQEISPTRSQGHHTLRNATSTADVHNQIWNGGDNLAYSDEPMTQRKTNQNCQPCKTSCQDVHCGEDRRCVLRYGIPKCICSPKCHLQDKATICGTDGRTYSSECQLLKRSCRKKQRLRVAHSGPCQTCSGVRCRKMKTCVLDELLIPRCQKCPENCPDAKKKRVICGTDGITYPSKCSLKSASCKAGIIIGKAYKGPCRESPNCDDVKCWRGETCLYDLETNQPRCQRCGDLRHCPWSATHICASDGGTYQSWCSLKHTSCKTGTALSVMPHHYCNKSDSRGQALRNTEYTSTTAPEIRRLIEIIGNEQPKNRSTSSIVDQETLGSLIEQKPSLDLRRRTPNIGPTARKKKRNFKRRKSSKFSRRESRKKTERKKEENKEKNQ